MASQKLSLDVSYQNACEITVPPQHQGRSWSALFLIYMGTHLDENESEN